MKKTSLKSICCLTFVICFSFSIKAQLPIKNSALAGEWKLVELNGEFDTYSYDCEKKEFYMSNDMFFQLGEALSDGFEKNTIKKAEKSIFKVKINGDYELSCGSDRIEKGIWKSKAVDKSVKGFIEDRLGFLILTSGSETFDVVVYINGQQLFLKFIMSLGGDLSQTYVFRKDFKGNAFK